MTALLMDGIQAFNVLVLVYFGLINVVYSANGVLAVRSMSRYVPRLGTFDSLEKSVISAAPPITPPRSSATMRPMRPPTAIKTTPAIRTIRLCSCCHM